MAIRAVNNTPDALIPKNGYAESLRLVNEKLSKSMLANNRLISRFLGRVGTAVAAYSSLSMALGERLGVYVDFSSLSHGLIDGTGYLYYSNFVSALGIFASGVIGVVTLEIARGRVIDSFKKCFVKSFEEDSENLARLIDDYSEINVDAAREEINDGLERSKHYLGNEFVGKVRALIPDRLKRLIDSELGYIKDGMILLPPMLKGEMHFLGKQVLELLDSALRVSRMRALGLLLKDYYEEDIILVDEATVGIREYLKANDSAILNLPLLFRYVRRHELTYSIRQIVEKPQMNRGERQKARMEASDLILQINTMFLSLTKREIQEITAELAHILNFVDNEDFLCDESVTTNEDLNMIKSSLSQFERCLGSMSEVLNPAELFVYVTNSSGLLLALEHIKQDNEFVRLNELRDLDSFISRVNVLFSSSNNDSQVKIVASKIRNFANKYRIRMRKKIKYAGPDIDGIKKRLSDYSKGGFDPKEAGFATAVLGSFTDAIELLGEKRTVSAGDSGGAAVAVIKSSK